jgi:NAD(P)H-nitrite reductase large subunit
VSDQKLVVVVRGVAGVHTVGAVDDSGHRSVCVTVMTKAAGSTYSKL